MKKPITASEWLDVLENANPGKERQAAILAMIDASEDFMSIDVESLIKRKYSEDTSIVIQVADKNVGLQVEDLYPEVDLSDLYNRVLSK